MVRDDFARFALEISIVDAEAGVKPFDFVRNELAGNKTLWEKPILRGPRLVNIRTRHQTFSMTAFSTRVRCSSLPLNTGVVYPGMFLTRGSDTSLLWAELWFDIRCAATDNNFGCGAGSVVNMVKTNMGGRNEGRMLATTKCLYTVPGLAALRLGARTTHEIMYNTGTQPDLRLWYFGAYPDDLSAWFSRTGSSTPNFVSPHIGTRGFAVNLGGFFANLAAHVWLAWLSKGLWFWDQVSGGAS